ncbi:DUF4232 domain-containing protein [Streptomyces sp. NPDC056568]|uniref:DUF4232 domain-containing protein n=1 Tax=Streptomyces sp. NPDC056568 TaxID=3345866 RepID=UPI0036CBB8F3
MRTTRPVESTGHAKPTRSTTAAVAVLTAALLLTACDDGGSGGDPGGSDSGSGTDDRAGAACRIAEVGVGIEPSPAPAAGDTGTVAVTLTNRGPACVLHGFPTVRLDAGGSSVPVPRDEAATPQRLTLDEQGTASFTVSYVRGGTDGTDGLTVRAAELALPDDASTHRFPWSYGTVATRGEGRPDATVGAFQRAGD